jgi:outer membrane protein assembly factor BamB
MEIKDGTIYAKSSNGLMAEIDPDTGTIIRTYLVY